MAVNKKKWLLILSYPLVIVLVFLACVKYSEEIQAVKDEFYNRYIVDVSVPAEEAVPGVDAAFSGYAPFEHSAQAWYLNTRLIYHACGGIDGLAYTNSREALEQTLADGNRFVEVDFSFTSDGELVCTHDWENSWGFEGQLPAREFATAKIFGKYTTLSAADIVRYMADYPDLYIVTDTKEGTKDKEFLGVIQALADLSAPYPGVTERFIIQLYTGGVKAQVKEIYPFDDENFLFTVYKFGSDPNLILDVCYKDDISVLTVPTGAFSAETLAFFVSKNIVVFEHTVNRPDLAAAELKKGAHGLYTDFLAAADLDIE